MKRLRISENTKRGLGILNKICLTMLVFIFLGLVDVWFLQEMAGDYNVADFEKQITGDNLTASDFEDTVEIAYGDICGEWITLTEDEEKDSETTGSGDGNEETVSMTPEEQIDIFADKVEEWSRGLSVDAAFAVADLNQDGRLELITDDVQGSGHFAYNNYFVVTEDGAMIKLESGRFGEYLSTYYDLADGLIHVPVYYDEKEDVFYSIQGGGTRDTHPISFCYRLVSLSIKNDVVEEELLAYRICKMDENNNWITPDRYEDADGNEIAEEEFETIAERKYSDLKQMQMTWKWHNYTEEIGAMSKEELKELLMDSYENFEMLKVGL